MEKEYFSHDYHARNDPKIQKLLSEKGYEGLGLFWCLVEKMYELSGCILKLECEGIAYEMRTQSDTVLNILDRPDLFNTDGVKYWSESVNRRIKMRCEKSEKARNSANFRWKNANAMRTHDSPNANAMLKRKEKKRKEKKRKETQYTTDFLSFLKEYPNQTGKRTAFISWQKIKPNLDLIIKALSWQKKTEQWTKENGKFVPMPVTYLNQRRWEDEPAKKKQVDDYSRFGPDTSNG
jgi:hypothetical protein